NAPNPNFEGQMFRIIHPFHPLYGKEFEIIEIRYGWEEERVWFYKQDQKLENLPLAWTNLHPPDPYLDLEECHSPFRVEDLLQLSDIIKEMKT
ncbi:MAG: DUF5372 family protein, partial [Candidatus Methanoperedens sp.]|nr:DUF5372 family protein [Candidatus Methanoperedens sp.]